MIDRTLDPLPRRTPRTGRNTHCGHGWFSTPTVSRARYFRDVSWWRLAALPATGLAGAALIESSAWTGNLVATTRILAWLMIIAGSYGLLARLAGILRRDD